MSKTVKELADNLGVTRQYIQKIISQLPETKKPTKQRHKYLIDARSESVILSFIKNNDNYKSKKATASDNKETNDLSDKYEKSLLNRINDLKKQVDSKDMQLSQMQKLVDQSQQLQLMAEKKIASLEAPKETEKQSQTAKSETSSTFAEDTKKEPWLQKQGFWHRIFK